MFLVQQYHLELFINVSILNNNISNISSVQYMGLPTSIGINAEYTDIY